MAHKEDNPPDRWLQGCCLILEREGYSPREAIVEAIREWREQGEMEEARLAQRSAR